jgi:hypothetical protein
LITLNHIARTHLGAFQRHYFRQKNDMPRRALPSQASKPTTQSRDSKSEHYLFDWRLVITVTMLPLITGDALGIHDANRTRLDRVG